ncbi:hypothetical protein CNMCM8927_003036 [Aspergillus lentulus]|uniref:N-acetyltransferase domain-containing protein n=1 Tax=Aspergillus lentulus TaxID=293939 RepID=A0AAN5YFZ3_ASPLE|nr:hypothetical protein CNMCM8927_003036 [Aspergillus lentulus]
MTNRTLEYRLATPDDAPQIQQLVQSAFRTQDSRPNWTGDTALAAGFSIGVEEILTIITKPDSAFLIATDTNGVLVASIGISRHSADFARLFLLAVSDEFQRGGIGRQVLAYAESYCQRIWGVNKGSLNALSNRLELILWYMRRGYRRTGELTPFPVQRVEGSALHEDLCFVEMEKEFNGGSVAA